MIYFHRDTDQDESDDMSDEQDHDARYSKIDRYEAGGCHPLPCGCGDAGTGRLGIGSILLSLDSSQLEGPRIQNSEH